MTQRNARMLEERGDFWSVPATYRCVTTNGVVRRDGRAVMGRGTALEAVRRNPSIDLPRVLGDLLRSRGNHVHLLSPTNLVSFPTKHSWRECSDLALIRQSALELARLVAELRLGPDARVVLPRPGCMSGGLRWEDVRPVIAPILSDKRFVVIVGDV